jgi:predicted esterase
MITRFLFLLLILGILIASCSPQTTVQDKTPRFAIQHDGREWHYDVYLPNNYDPDKTYWPLIQLYGPMGLDRLASEGGLDAIVIYTGGFKNNYSGTGNGDYLKKVIRDAQSKYKLRDKILITGHSAGAGVGHRFTLQNPEWVHAAAPYSSGSWTTPDGRYLMTGRHKQGETPVELPHEEVEAYLINHERENQRLGAKLAGLKAQPGAEKIPFLVMCGTLDPRWEFGKRFAQILEEQGYYVETEWPETTHAIGKPPNSDEESARYNTRIIDFFLRMTDGK